ncbi:plasmid stabilization protein [Dactylosporangium sp. CA-152071]|uniref:plasmid stabilization protein n=1 Tax=Dactylosporangium sp. CA-152071 TaxID=3239933 RepID=UPI003D8B1CD2
MPQQVWSAKRERQYGHVKRQQLAQGRPEEVAEEIAARVVNKERARAGESRTASRTSTQDMSSAQRGALRARTTGPAGRTRDQLYEEARRKNVKGRSRMTKAELEKALR